MVSDQEFKSQVLALLTEISAKLDGLFPKVQPVVPGTGLRKKSKRESDAEISAVAEEMVLNELPEMALVDLTLPGVTRPGRRKETKTEFEKRVIEILKDRYPNVEKYLKEKQSDWPTRMSEKEQKVRNAIELARSLGSHFLHYIRL